MAAHRRWRTRGIAPTVLTVVMQLLVVAFTWLMLGAHWRGATYVLALAQSVAALGLIVWWGRRNPIVVMVPFASAVLSSLLYQMGPGE
jgi:hypothetical protein